jgi:iron complex transport system substrate-binding protein
LPREAALSLVDYESFVPMVLVQLIDMYLETLGEFCETTFTSQSINRCSGLCLARVHADQELDVFFSFRPLFYEPKQMNWVLHAVAPIHLYNPIMPENRLPRRVVSLQPSITVTLRDLGLLDRLAACTRYCVDICPEVRQAGCAIVEDSWSAKAEQILAAKPDLVIASVPYQLESLAEIIKAVPCLCLSPKSLADVYEDILHIARVVSSEEPDGEKRGTGKRTTEQRAIALVEHMQDEIEAVRRKIEGQATPPLQHEDKPLVYCEEWGKPLILSQRWAAELVEAAGGRFYGEPGKHASEEEVVAAGPDVIVAAWCGAGDRVPLEKIIARRGWEQTKAATNGRVYCINDEFLNTPASTLLQGLHALAAAVHPELFAMPQGLRRIALAAQDR